VSPREEKHLEPTSSRFPVYDDREDRETPRPLEERWMLTAFVFDEEQSEQVDDWGAALERLDRGQLLWVAARDPTEEELASLRETLELGAEIERRLREHPSSASVADEGERLHVTLYAVSGEGDEPTLVPVECVLGPDWIITVFGEKVEVLDEFLERAEGGGQVGELDAPSFVATIFEWVIASYLRAFEAVERELEELDARVMTDTPKEVADELARLVELRRTIGSFGARSPRTARWSSLCPTRSSMRSRARNRRSASPLSSNG
jgi:Mg2+ and Co2+ transporter CorA